jgi:hypothetical protein
VFPIEGKAAFLDGFWTVSRRFQRTNYSSEIAIKISSSDEKINAVNRSQVFVFVRRERLTRVVAGGTVQARLNKPKLKGTQVIKYSSNCNGSSRVTLEADKDRRQVSSSSGRGCLSRSVCVHATSIFASNVAMWILKKEKNNLEI